MLHHIPKQKPLSIYQENLAMATLLQTLIPLALFVILAMANSAQSETVPAQTNFYYTFYGGDQPNLTLQGDAHFLPDSGNLRLTKTDSASNPLPNSAGRVLYSNPVALWNSTAQADFESTIEFIVKPGTNNDDPADGLVFFIAPVNSTFPSAYYGGSLGIFDSSGHSSSVFAVEFDIYVNGWDPKFRHLGIDIESTASISTSKEVPVSYLGKQLRLYIHYVEATNTITATLYYGAEIVAEVSQVYDLTSFLPQDVQVGLAASTGTQVANHDVVVWEFDSTMVDLAARIRQYV